MRCEPALTCADITIGMQFKAPKSRAAKFE
jgi:hypothetical protein